MQTLPQGARLRMKIISTGGWSVWQGGHKLIVIPVHEEGQSGARLSLFMEPRVA